MNRPAPISVFSDQRRTKSTIWSRVSCGTQTPVRVPQLFFWGNMFRHQFGQNLILRLDLPFQLGDSFLFGLMVGASSLLKSCGSVLEELLLPGVEHRRLEPQLVTQIRDRYAFPPNASSEWRPSLPACSASVASSCVRSVILTDERFLHFHLRQDSPETPRVQGRPESTKCLLVQSVRMVRGSKTSMRNFKGSRGISRTAKSLKRNNEDIQRNCHCSLKRFSPFTEVPSMCDFHPGLWTGCWFVHNFTGAYGKPAAV